jgi:predicted  nucleic acid-binding Zn-ribbon protein
MNTIVNEAVKLTNESNQKQVVAQATMLIGKIQAEQASIRSEEKRIAGFQEQVSEIADASITISSVMGDVDLPNDGNPNTATILAAIAEANKKAQETVKIASTNLVADITAAQRNIAACNERISKLREQLTELSAASVTVSGVMGS